MSHGEGDDLEAQAWPGFVDILSSTMIMFVFFLMITATALFFHTIMFKSKLLSRNEEVVTEKVEERVKSLIEENKMLKEQVEELQQRPTEDKNSAAGNSKEERKINLLQQSTEFAASTQQEVKTVIEGKEMYVFFGDDAISVTKDTDEQIKKFLEPYKGKSVRINIQANKSRSDDMALTARKVSVARMLNVRNLFIQAKFDPQKVNAVVVEREPVDEKSDWVKITMEAE